jgi:hypothetical protein
MRSADAAAIPSEPSVDRWYEPPYRAEAQQCLGFFVDLVMVLDPQAHEIGAIE